MEHPTEDDETTTLLRAFEELTEGIGGSEATNSALQAFGRDLERFARHRDLVLLRYQLLFHEAPDPYLVTDPDGRIVEANAAATDLLCIDTTIVGSNLIDYVATEHREAFAGWLDRVNAGAVAVRWDTVFDLPGNAENPVEISLADDLTGIGHRWQLRDQRQRVAAERQLREVAQHEHEVAQALRTEGRTKSGFLVSLSHDLRGPVGALVHQAELLTMPQLPDEVRQRSRAAMQSNATLLSQLLDALVDIERFALGELRVRPRAVPLADLLHELDDEDGDRTRARCQAGIVVDADASILRRGLRGLIDAARSQAEDTEVTIDAEAVDGAAHIVISAPCDHAESDTSSLENRIAVRLARTLIDLHDGSVEASQVDNIRQIHVALPLAAGAADIDG